MTARELAASVLLRCEKDLAYSSIALDTALRKESLPQREAALATALVYGVLERQYTLDYRLSPLSSRPYETLAPIVRTLLRLGAYQILYMDRIPDSAACNETVNLCKKQQPAAAGYCNAILRALVREKAQPVEWPSEQANRISAEFSVSESIARLLLSQYGNDSTRDILTAFFKRDPLGITVNETTCNVDDLVSDLADANASVLDRVATHLNLTASGAVPSLPGFENGAFFVQDRAAYLTIAALDPHPCDRVLDLCSAPGGKTLAAAARMRGEGEIISCDIHENKLSLVLQSARRLGFSCVETKALDARKAPLEWECTFDKVICDVPCSGIGVLRKKPEIRCKDASAFSGLPAIQYDILTSGARCLKNGGSLVYSTCTLNREENEQVIERFLSSHPDFHLCRPDIPERYLSASRNDVLFRPDLHDTDGFYFALLQKR